MPAEVLEEKEFQDKVLNGVGALESEAKVIKTAQQQLLENYGQLDVVTKKLMEDFTALKKVANDQQANHDSFVKAFKTLEAQLRNEARQAFGDPVQRICNDDEMKARLNAAFRKAAGRGGDMNRVVAKILSGAGDEVQKALGEDASPGSTLIDDRLAREIYDTLARFGVWNTFAVRNLGTKQTKFPVSTARVLANFILTEGGTIADDTTKAGTSVTLEVEVVAALLLVSMQLLEDAEVDLVPELLNEFGEAYANRIDHACLNAAGAASATDGGMTGVFQGGTAALAAAGNVTTETTDFEDWIKCLVTVDPICLTRMSKWWIHPQIVARALAVKDANGRPIFLTAIEAPSFGALGTILGYPIVPSFAAPSTNTINSKIAVFGDPNGNVAGVRRDFSFGMSDDFKFDTLQRAFRGWGRFGNKIRRSQAFAVLTLPAA